MIRIGLKTGRKLVHFCTAFVVHFYTTLDTHYDITGAKKDIQINKLDKKSIFSEKY